MNNTKAVDLNTIAVGDRIGIRSPDFQDSFEHWGKVISRYSPTSFHVQMDDPELPKAEGYETQVAGVTVECFFTAGSEIKAHIPKDKVALHEGKPVNIEDHGQPTVFASVVSQLHETISYLEQMTGKKFEPTIHSFGLSAEGTYTDNNVTIRFVEKGK